jgi:hypothetical protein
MDCRWRVGIQRPDPVVSSFGLLRGFLGALGVVAAGKVFGRSLERPCLLALIGIVIITSLGQSLPAAAYNGAVSGLFFNFVFRGAGERLRFASRADWAREAWFVAAGLLSAVSGRVSIDRSGSEVSPGSPRRGGEGIHRPWGWFARWRS